MKKFVKEILGEVGDGEMEIRMLITEIIEELLPIKLRKEINKLIEDGTIPTLEDFTKARHEMGVETHQCDGESLEDRNEDEVQNYNEQIDNESENNLINDDNLVETIKLVVQNLFSENEASYSRAVAAEPLPLEGECTSGIGLLSTEYDIDEYGIQVYTALKNRLEQKSKHLAEEYDRLDREVCYMIVRQTVPKEEVVPLQNKLELIREEKRKVDELLGIIE